MIETLKTTFISPRGTISSKRLTGFLMITLAGALITYSALTNIEFNNNLTGLVRDMIYGGVALVGSTIFEKKFINCIKFVGHTKVFNFDLFHLKNH